VMHLTQQLHLHLGGVSKQKARWLAGLFEHMEQRS
jgi:hypothetical protein